MLKRAGFLNVLTLFAAVTECLFAQALPLPSDADCVQLNLLARARLANGELKQAEAVLSGAWNRVTEQPRSDCAGVILNNLAAVMLNSGRLSEAEKLAKEAVDTLGNIHPADHRILLRPLQILCAARLERGDLAAARRAFLRLKLIQAENPHDRALVHGMAALIAVRDSNDGDAETEYLAAVSALKEAGADQTADFAVLVEALGSLYTRQQRFEKARQAFVQASAIFNVAKDTVPLDLIDFLNLRANLHVNLREWPEADSDLTRALRLARDQPSLDPLILELLFRNYAIVLRNTHRKREAHEFEARAAALHTHSGAVVDVSELLAGH